MNDLIILNYKSAYEGQYTCEAQSTGTLITNKKVVVKKYQVKTAGKLFLIYSPLLISSLPHPLLIPSLSLCELYLSSPAASSHQPTTDIYFKGILGSSLNTIILTFPFPTGSCFNGPMPVLRMVYFCINYITPMVNGSHTHHGHYSINTTSYKSVEVVLW